MKKRFLTIGMVLVALMFVSTSAMAALIDGSVAITSSSLTSYSAGGGSISGKDSTGDLVGPLALPATGGTVSDATANGNVSAGASFTTASATASVDIYLNDVFDAAVSGGAGGGTLLMPWTGSVAVNFSLDATVSGADAEANFGILIDAYDYITRTIDLIPASATITSGSGTAYNWVHQYMVDPTNPAGMAYVFSLDEAAIAAAGGNITDTFTATVTYGTTAPSGAAVGQTLVFAKGAALDAAPVPIPGAAWLLGSGFLGLVGSRRRIWKK